MHKYLVFYNIMFLSILLANIILFTADLVLSQKQIVWGKIFGGANHWENINMSCTHNTHPVCCVALEDLDRTNRDVSLVTTRGVGRGLSKLDESSSALHHMKHHANKHLKCTIKRVYVPSKYELRHFEMAKYVAKNSTDLYARRRLLIELISSESEIEEATYWTQRVKDHMASESIPPELPEDRNFLSRFVVTKACDDSNGGVQTEAWEEWIEPISIHFRHPFSLNNANKDLLTAFSKYPKGYKEISKPIINSEHVLLQSALSFYNNSRINYGLTHTNRPNHHFLLDAGSSMFSSSISFFSCAYSQRKVSFNEVYTWELTLLEPSKFWEDVPTRWKPFYHFYNIPITSAINSSDSPLAFIDQAAEVDDFVAFKLDVDTPAVELPILQYILEHPEIAAKIDEFFFELHFLCEIMIWLGWGEPKIKEFMGKPFDRVFAFESFTKLREMGIRAHIWP